MSDKNIKREEKKLYAEQKNVNAEQQRINEQNAVVTDAQLESGEFPLGRMVHISTVTHAFRGYLENVTPSHYILKKGTCEVIHDSGEVTPYSESATSKPREGERVACQVRIPRGSVAWEFCW